MMLSPAQKELNSVWNVGVNCMRFSHQVINLCFILFYVFEMCMKIFAFGWKGYLSYKSNIFDGFLTVLLLVRAVGLHRSLGWFMTVDNFNTKRQAIPAC